MSFCFLFAKNVPDEKDGLNLYTTSGGGYYTIFRVLDHERVDADQFLNLE